MRDLVIYSQKDVFALKPGEKLPSIINPGIDPSDGLSELVEGRDYNPDDFVQVNIMISLVLYSTNFTLFAVGWS